VSGKSGRLRNAPTAPIPTSNPSTSTGQMKREREIWGSLSALRITPIPGPLSLFRGPHRFHARVRRLVADLVRCSQWCRCFRRSRGRVYRYGASQDALGCLAAPDRNHWVASNLASRWVLSAPLLLSLWRVSIHDPSLASCSSSDDLNGLRLCWSQNCSHS
jgi:hypothetical protein